MDRRTFLLEQAKEALEDGAVPLSEWFIQEHHVRFDEAHELEEDMTTAIELYLLMRARVNAGAERIKVRH